MEGRKERNERRRLDFEQRSKSPLFIAATDTDDGAEAQLKCCSLHPTAVRSAGGARESRSSLDRPPRPIGLVRRLVWPGRECLSLLCAAASRCTPSRPSSKGLSHPPPPQHPGPRSNSCKLPIVVPSTTASAPLFCTASHRGRNRWPVEILATSAGRAVPVFIHSYLSVESCHRWQAPPPDTVDCMSSLLGTRGRQTGRLWNVLLRWTHRSLSRSTSCPGTTASFALCCMRLVCMMPSTPFPAALQCGRVIHHVRCCVTIACVLT